MNSVFFFNRSVIFFCEEWLADSAKMLEKFSLACRGSDADSLAGPAFPISLAHAKRAACEYIKQKKKQLHIKKKKQFESCASRP